MTTEGGYTIHGKMSTIPEAEILDFLGLERICRRGAATVFQKRAPNLERYPEGLYLRGRTIVYDQQTNEFRWKQL